MGRNRLNESKAKAPLGQGKSARNERKKRKRGQEELQAQLGQLHNAKKLKLEKEGLTGKSTGFAKAFQPAECKVELPPFQRYFWGGSTPDGDPDDALKLQRKRLGIKVKGSPTPPPVETFSDPLLPQAYAQFFKGARGSKLSRPTPIQMQVWPAALCGLDVLGIAPTGSGKTLSYLLPAVPHIQAQLGNKDALSPICLVLLPTRELASQVADQVKGKGGLRQIFGIRGEAIYGGVGKETQLDSILTSGCAEIIAATPGRLLDLLGLDAMSLRSASYLVLDEADRMLALGFEEQLDAISKGIRKDRQCLLFSATFPLRLQQAAERWLTSHEQVTVRVGTVDVGMEESLPKESIGGSSSSTTPAEDTRRGDTSSTLSVASSIEQIVHVCAAHKKQRKLLKFLDQVRAEEKAKGVRQRALVIIFCNKIQTLKSLASFLCKQNHYCAPLHSGIPQAKREQALNEFKAGRLQILVASDVAARGLHVKHLRYVVNFDFPSNLEQYCHRIGRTGRDGESGTAYSFFTRNLAALSKDLVQLLEKGSAKVDPNLRALAEGRASHEDDEGEEDCAIEGGQDTAADADDSDDGNGRMASAPTGPNSDAESDTGGVGAGGGLRIRPRKKSQEEDSGEDSEEAKETSELERGDASNKQGAQGKKQKTGGNVKRPRGRRGGKKSKR